MVEALGNGASRVYLMAQILQLLADSESLGIALFWNLITYRPHDDRGVIAIGKNKVGDVKFIPIVKEARVAVLALGIHPHIEALGHDHHTQRIADIHLHL